MQCGGLHLRAVSWANYIYRHAAVAISPSPRGPFKPLRSIQPDTHPSLDLNLFTDPVARGGDGQTYFVRSVLFVSRSSHIEFIHEDLLFFLCLVWTRCRSCNNKFIGISKLSTDFIATTGITSRIDDRLEAPVMFRGMDGTSIPSRSCLFASLPLTFLYPWNRRNWLALTWCALVCMCARIAVPHRVGTSRVATCAHDALSKQFKKR